MLAATTLFKMLLVTSILSQAVHCQRLLGRSRREATNTPLSSTDAPVEVSEAVDKLLATGEVLSTAASTRTQRSYYGGGSSERLFDLGGLLGSRTYYSGNRGYYPSGGYYPQGDYYPQGGYLPQGGYYPGGGYGGSGYYPGTNTLGVGSPAYGGGSYGGYGGYGGFGGNGGLQSYYGYNNDNYYGNRNLGYGYYSGTSPSGYVGSTLVSGFRGYN